QGLYGQQVYRYGVRRKGIDQEVVEGRFRLASERQAGIAHYEFGIRLADAEIAEQHRVGRDPYDLGVDFEEAPALAGNRVTCHGPGAQADNSHAQRLRWCAACSARQSQALRQRARWMVIRKR